MRSLRQTVQFLLMAMLVFSCSGCMQGTREKLAGRWYTPDTSVRFRPDGTVVYNSPRGLAVGRYFLNETPKDVTSTAPHPNLILEVVRKNEVVRLEFEAEILSQDRLRLTEILPQTGQRRPTAGQFKVLKRATEKDEAAQAPLAAVSTTR